MAEQNEDLRVKPQQNAADLLAMRGCSPKKVELVRRWGERRVHPA
jgi:hypothetical protein